MKKLFLISTLSLFSLYAFAQKVDLDRFYFPVAYQQLPKVYVEPAARTYSLDVKVGSRVYVTSSDNFASKINMPGYKEVKENPTVVIKANLEDFYGAGAKSSSRTQESKDKAGRVTTTYYYKYSEDFTGKGTYSVVGPKGIEVAEKKEKKESKTEQTVNKFLTKATGTTESSDPNKFNKSGSLGYTTTYSTEEFSNTKDAYNAYLAQSNLSRTKMEEFVNTSSNIINGSLEYYAFSPVKEQEFLWILDSKSHPEYADQQEAIKAVKTLFATMKAHESIATLEENLKPLLDYFETIPTKYTADEKRDKKMRYSAYYNLAKLYYYLDKPDLCIKYAEKLIANGYDEKDGEKLKEKAENLKVAFQKAKTTSTHNDLNY